jgi:hypothetical protein
MDTGESMHGMKLPYVTSNNESPKQKIKPEIQLVS